MDWLTENKIPVADVAEEPVRGDAGRVRQGHRVAPLCVGPELPEAVGNTAPLSVPN